jgi:hypothetical protein
MLSQHLLRDFIYLAKRNGLHTRALKPKAKATDTTKQI